MLAFNTLLVPVDFSAISRAVFKEAVELARGDGAAIILLHVIDPALTEFAAELGLERRSTIAATARARAQRELVAIKETAGGRIDVQVIVSEGVPFLEVLRKAEDFQVDAILMGRFGTRGPLEKLLFGTTAERVIRGTTRAVIVVPVDI